VRSVVRVGREQRDEQRHEQRGHDGRTDQDERPLGSSDASGHAKQKEQAACRHRGCYGDGTMTPNTPDPEQPEPNDPRHPSTPDPRDPPALDPQDPPVMDPQDPPPPAFDPPMPG
jgi:hypothetical protein